MSVGADVYGALFDANPDGVLLVGADGRIVQANPAAQRLFGYPREQLVGMSVDTLVPDSVAPAHAALRDKYSHAPKARPMGTDMDLRARRADGSEVLVEIALSPLAVNGVRYVMASIRGIGNYPRVQRALQRVHYSEHVVQVGRLAVDTRDPQELLRHVPHVVAQAMRTDAVAVCLLDATGAELRLVSSFGLDEHDPARAGFANRSDTPLGHVVATAAPLIISNFAAQQQFAQGECLFSRGAVSGLAVPLNDKGKVIGVLATRTNVQREFGPEEVAFLEALSNLLATSLQRTHTEAQLSHAQRMESVGQLTGGIAHDFNNLLTVIQGNLQMLAEHAGVKADRHCQQLVNAATRAGQRGAELTGKLLAFSRRQALAPERIQPAAMLASLADMLSRTIGKHIHVVVDAQPDCPDCRADPVQLESALLNIAINARDAMPAGGTLTFSCAGVDPGLAEPLSALAPQLRAEPGAATAAAAAAAAGTPGAPWIRIAVRDTGTGMTAAVRDRAFEPFFTTKEVGRGTGMGLSTVYGFVTQSGGTIHIDSSPGAGSTVVLCLPGIPRQTAPADAPRANAAGDRGLQVLLVEDDADVRAVAMAFLEGMGCTITACADAQAALQALADSLGSAGTPPSARPFDLLFSDITLGSGLNGIELAARAQELQPALRVLLTSGYSKYLAGNGAPQPWPVLRKPYSKAELAEAVSAVAVAAAAAVTAMSAAAPD